MLELKLHTISNILILLGWIRGIMLHHLTSHLRNWYDVLVLHWKRITVLQLPWKLSRKSKTKDLEALDFPPPTRGNDVHPSTKNPQQSQWNAIPLCAKIHYLLLKYIHSLKTYYKDRLSKLYVCTHILYIYNISL